MQDRKRQRSCSASDGRDRIALDVAGDRMFVTDLGDRSIRQVRRIGTASICCTRKAISQVSRTRNSEPLKGELIMSNSRPIRRIAIIGTGVIGASWAAQFLAKGLTSSRPTLRRMPRLRFEASSRRPGRRSSGWGSRPARPQSTPHVHGGYDGRGAGRGLRPGKRTRADRLQEEALSATRRIIAGRRDHRVELVRSHHERDSIDCRCIPSVVSSRISVQSAHLVPLVEIVGGAKDFGSDHSARRRVLTRDWEADRSPAQGSAGSCGQPLQSHWRGSLLPCRRRRRERPPTWTRRCAGGRGCAGASWGR